LPVASRAASLDPQPDWTVRPVARPPEQVQP
jgi:hypothetical protein